MYIELIRVNTMEEKQTRVEGILILPYSGVLLFRVIVLVALRFGVRSPVMSMLW